MKFRRESRNLLFGLALAATCGIGAGAEISGTVRDGTAAVLPDVEISVINVETGMHRRTATNQSGFYAVAFLPPGAYRLTARREGFMVVTRGDLRIGAGQTLWIDVSLAVASVRETVSVSYDLLNDQTSAELGTVVDPAAVSSLPLNGRNITQLLALTPGVTPVSTAQGSVTGVGDAFPTGIPGSQYLKPSYHGQQNRSQIVYMDGIINTDFRSNSYAILPSIDLIQEFKVQAHNDKVEWGGVAGGVVNLVSKSGSNEVHGSGFWFVRNEALDARDPFKDVTRESPAPFRQNQFGATVGGPAIRNRTFFYGGYDGWRYRRPSQSLARVPTVEELGGDFSASIVNRDIYDPFSTRTEGGDYVRAPFPGRIIPPALLNPMSKRFVEIYEESPNHADPVYNFINSVSSRDDANSFQIKLDHQPRESDNLFFRWSRQLRNSVQAGGPKKSSGTAMTADNYGGGWLHMFSPDVIVNVRGGAARRDFRGDVETHAAGLAAMKTLGFRDVDRFGGLRMELASPWRGGIGLAGAAPRENPTYNVSGDASWAKGDHSLKGGIQWVGVERLQINTSQTFFYDDSTTADPQRPGVTGTSLASALLGLPVRFEGYLPEEGKIHFGIDTWSGYFQDEWRIRPNITLNYGIRFDHNAKPVIYDGMQSGPDLDRGLWLIGAGSMPPPCNGAGGGTCIPGNGLSDVPFGERIVLAHPPVYVPKQIWDNWGPRAGLAARITRKTVVRAGYGLYWDSLVSNSQYTQHNVNNWPMTIGFVGSANGLGQPLRTIQDIEGSYAAALPEPSPWERQGWFNDPERKNGYSHQWNVEVQRQLSEDLTASAAYVGSWSGRLEYSGLGNSARQPGHGTPEEVQARRPVPFLNGGVFYSRSMGTANYNALEVKMRRRFARGLQMLVSYTWSKSIDAGSSGWFAAEEGPGGSSAAQNYHDPKSNRSVSAYDIPHFLSWYTVWETPFGKGKRWWRNGAAAAMLGNWQVNSIVQWRSGQPFNLAVAGDVANIGNERAGWYYARPNLAGNPRLENPTVDRYFNVEAFAIPYFTYGNFGRNVLRTDRVFNADVSVFKLIPVGEGTRKQLELRIEAFNVFNHIDWAAPETLIGFAGAGRITATEHEPRVIQLGVRFVY
ncbi:MAG: carboxypeptidase regulatory-like domain-containing protein [Bryobacteraceae bacterium]|nr:carboxypeptidase regulatory-like domain-containing protein [Bryobacteraceae bacterium]